MKRYMTILVCIIATLLLNQLSAQDVEPNNTIATASSMALNGNTSGSIFINPTDDSFDYYEVVLDDDGAFSATFTPADGLNAYVRIYLKSGTQLTSTYVVGPATGTASVSCMAKDTVYVAVARFNGSGSYQLSNSLSAPANHDQDIEPNNSVAEANVFYIPNETIEGRLGYTGVGITDGVDYYGLLPGDDGSMTLTSTIDSTLLMYTRFYNKNGSQLGTVYGTGEKSVTINCVANDTIYAAAVRFQGCGSYSMTYTVDTPPNHAQDIEPNNSVAEANVFYIPNETIEGRLGYTGVGITDGVDYYGLLPGDDGSMTLTSTIDSTLLMYTRFYNKNGSQLGTVYGTGEKSVTINCVANDTIYAAAVRWTGCGSYSMTFTIAPPEYSNDLEENGSLLEAQPLATGELVEGHFGHTGVGISDQDDWYEFTVQEAPFILNADLVLSGTIAAYLRLKSDLGSELESVYLPAGTTATFDHTITDPGTYYIQVDRWAGCGSYKFGDLCSMYPTVVASPEGPMDKCPEASIDLDATSGLTAYEWFNYETYVGGSQLYSASTPGGYQVVGYDINACPDTSEVVFISDFDCDDNDPCTDDSCSPGIGCVNTYSGDDDSDGTCNNLDLCPQDPEKIVPGNCGCGNPEPETACDDEDFTTIDDVITSTCECLGTLIDCPGDVNGDFIVDINDFIDLNSAYGSSCTGCPEDLNEDGVVGIDDFLELNSNYGNNCLALISNMGSVRGVNPKLQSDIDNQGLSTIDSELAKIIEGLGSSVDIDIAPNPNEGRRFEIRLNTTDTEEHLVNVVILDITGKQVHLQEAYMRKGETSFFIEPQSTLESGMYLLQFRIGTATYSKRMSVQ